MNELHSRWGSLWAKIGPQSTGDEIYRDLTERYSEPHRAYHNLEHVGDCLRQVDKAPHLLTRPEETELAVWFHDAVNDPRRSGHEESSARFAETTLIAAGIDDDVARRIGELVRTTNHDREALTGDAAFLCDVDLSILGAEPERFERYDAAIRREYAWVSEGVYRRERGRVLAGFLARVHIYHTQFWRERLEERARANLTGALERYVA